ncbi:MAG: protein TolR [Pseudomonadota bacterium]|nr:protein TolR [Pseudomonadota bacterium]
MFEHSRRSRKSQMSEINVVPYIDVMLVLLVIFMVTTPLLTQGVEVDLPEAIADEVKDPDVEPFLLSVDRNGQLFANEEKQPVSGEEIVRKAAIVYKRNPKTPFLVKGDRRVEYQAVMTAMVLLKQAGIPKVGLVTEPPEK